MERFTGIVVCPKASTACTIRSSFAVPLALPPIYIKVLSITSSAELSGIIHRLDPDFVRRYFPKPYPTISDCPPSPS